MMTHFDGRTLARRRAAAASMALACCALAAAVGGCKQQAPQAQAQTAKTAAPVETEAATTGEVVKWTQVTGSLVSQTDVPLAAKVTGRLATLMVREGDAVEPGQVVAQLDLSDFQSQVRSAEAAVAAAGARVSHAEAAHRQTVSSTGSAVKAAEAAYGQQTTNTKVGIDTAEAGLAAARAVLSQVREGARKQDIRRSETQVSIARANLKKAQADLRRFRTLADDGALSEAALEQYQTAEQVAREQLAGAEETLSLVKEGARSQEVVQAEQALRQAEERLRQARAGSAMDEVRKADVETARAALAQNDVRRADVLAARAALQQAMGGLQIARKALSDASIRCPIAGQVSVRTGNPGQVVSPGTQILRVVALNTVFFEPTVTERELRQVRVGQPVQVDVNAFPGRRFTGTVTRIYPSASEGSRAFSVRVSLANPEGLLRPRMFAQGRIEAERHGGAVMVPEGAVVGADEAGKARVFVAEGGIARAKRVTVGLSSDDGRLVQVTGVKAGARVVVAGQQGLTDGSQVTAAEATTR
ncbi:MAG: efflux RND transporter periplasmic adaptor subunit [Armatimonadetes bacterium]|nr:efflux RND transporter periplasmic adaptor subunit [Armatimonadota bacterium]